MIVTAVAGCGPGTNNGTPSSAVPDLPDLAIVSVTAERYTRTDQYGGSLMSTGQDLRYHITLVNLGRAPAIGQVYVLRSRSLSEFLNYKYSSGTAIDISLTPDESVSFTILGIRDLDANRVRFLVNLYPTPLSPNDIATGKAGEPEPPIEELRYDNNTYELDFPPAG